MTDETKNAPDGYIAYDCDGRQLHFTFDEFEDEARMKWEQFEEHEVRMGATPSKEDIRPVWLSTTPPQKELMEVAREMRQLIDKYDFGIWYDLKQKFDKLLPTTEGK